MFMNSPLSFASLANTGLSWRKHVFETCLGVTEGMGDRWESRPLCPLAPLFEKSGGQKLLPFNIDLRVSEDSVVCGESNK